MKDATGEMGMTVIVIIAVAAVLLLFRSFVWPALQDKIGGSVNEIDNSNLNNEVLHRQ